MKRLTISRRAGCHETLHCAHRTEIMAWQAVVRGVWTVYTPSNVINQSINQLKTTYIYTYTYTRDQWLTKIE